MEDKGGTERKRWCVHQTPAPDGAMKCVADESRDLVCPYPTPADHSQSGMPCMDCKPVKE